MVKDSTIAILALGGAGLFLLSRTDFFKGIGKTSAAVGEAASGLGSGISTIGREAGDIVVDLGSLLEPVGALGQGTASLIESGSRAAVNRIEREAEQEDTIDRAAFALSSQAEAEIQSGADINRAREQATRSGLIQDQLTDITKVFTNIDEVIISGAKKAGQALVSSPLSPIGAVSSLFKNRVAEDTPISLSASGGSAGSIKLPESKNLKVSVQTIPASSPTKTTTTTQKSPSLRQQITSSVSTAASKVTSTAKSLITKGTSFLRGLF